MFSRGVVATYLKPNVMYKIILARGISAKNLSGSMIREKSVPDTMYVAGYSLCSHKILNVWASILIVCSNIYFQVVT